MPNLSDKLSSLQFTPKPQSPAFAGAVVNVPLAQVSKYQEKNYFLCDGSEYSETTYDQLFAACGTQYNTGGETAGFFRVPNGPRRTAEVDLALSGDPTSVLSAKGYYYQDYLGDHRLKFNVHIGTASQQSRSFSIDGTVWNIQQAVAVGLNSTVNFGDGFTNSTGNTIQLSSNGARSSWRVWGDIVLTAIPTDAFVGADSRFSTFDEALQFQPMIKVYDDASNISMSLADATATKTGAVRLSSDFAATANQYGFVTHEVGPWSPSITFGGTGHSLSGLVIHNAFYEKTLNFVKCYVIATWGYSSSADTQQNIICTLPFDRPSTDAYNLIGTVAHYANAGNDVGGIVRGSTGDVNDCVAEFYKSGSSPELHTLVFSYSIT
jgi:microcystin-dependent protein